MKFALGFQFLNEASWLRLHLPVILQSSRIDGVVAVDGGSTDNSRIVILGLCAKHKIEVHLFTRAWDWDFSKQQNFVVERCEELGYDAYFKWDPDELLWPRHIDAIAGLLREYKVVITPRYNFSEDRQHFCPYLCPDKQLRFVQLNQGFRWHGNLHAGTNAYQLWREDPNNTSPRAVRDIIFVPHMPIYHYEGIKPLAERALKWLNYERVADGLPAVTELPPDHPVPQYPLRATIPFMDPQPLDPAVIGLHAPYGE
jgi:hypothetical protein